MNDKLNSFYKSLHNKKVSFIGLGRSHRELLPMFAAKGAIVTLRDKRTREQIGEEADKLKLWELSLPSVRTIWKICVRRTSSCAPQA